MESLAFQKFYFEAIFAISSFVHIIGLYLCNVCSTHWTNLLNSMVCSCALNTEHTKASKEFSIFSAVNIGDFLSILQYFALNYMKKERKVNLQKRKKEASKNAMKSILIEHSSFMNKIIFKKLCQPILHQPEFLRPAWECQILMVHCSITITFWQLVSSFKAQLRMPPFITYAMRGTKIS